MKRYFCLLIFLIFTLIACGGGGGSSSGTSGSPDTGTVALYLADGPTDEYESIWVRVEEISLLPSDNETHVTVFKSDDSEGYKVDLLALKNQDLLLTVNETIPTGRYSKIRLKISGIEPEGGTGECSDFEVKLPSGKIDLVPETPFNVVAGSTMNIRLDIDADKSINLHTAGNSGKCIFRPVVFVDITSEADSPAACPQNLTGSISELAYDTDNATVAGFKLDMKDGRGELNVSLTAATAVFDSGGLPTQPSALKNDQTVFVRGRLNSNSRLEAAMVVIGGVQSFKGTVEESDADSFAIDLANESGTLNVSLTDDTFIFRKCNDAFNGTVIPAGATVNAFGKFISGDTANEFRAVLVLFETNITQTTLTAIEKTAGGYNLSIQDSTGATARYYLPDGAAVKLEGNGALAMAALTDLVDCQSRSVDLDVADETDNPPSLSGLTVTADRLSVEVTGKDADKRILNTDAGSISVEETATLFKLYDERQELIAFKDITAGDELNLFGLYACANDENGILFYAHSGIVMPE